MTRSVEHFTVIPASQDETRCHLEALEEFISDAETVLAFREQVPKEARESFKELEASIKCAESLRECLHTALYRPALCSGVRR